MPQLIYDMPEAEYHARPELSVSKLKDFITSPLNYWYNHINPDRPARESSEAFEIGSAVHKIVLEGMDAFNAAYADPMPADLKKPTAAQLNAAKPSDKTIEQLAAWNDWEVKQKGRIVLSNSDRATVMKCYNAVQQHSEAMKGLGSIKAVEVSAFYEYGGHALRSRFDGVTDLGIIDLKTTTDASAWGFNSSIRKFGYHFQAFLYMKAFEICFERKPEHFTFIVVEKSAPYHVAVYRLDDDYLKMAESTVNGKLAYLSHCIETNTWPGINDDELKILSPRYKEGD